MLKATDLNKSLISQILDTKKDNKFNPKPQTNVKFEAEYISYIIA